jgi:prepilin-type processing-associated H-X9-DG protein
MKESDIIRPPPAKLLVMVDENDNSINDSAWGFEMPGDRATAWVDVPSKRHGSACGFNFADGHAEIRHWMYPQYLAAEVPYGRLDYTYVEVNTPELDPDIFWCGWRVSYPTDAMAAAWLMNFPDYP